MFLLFFVFFRFSNIQPHVHMHQLILTNETKSFKLGMDLIVKYLDGKVMSIMYHVHNRG